MGEEWEIWGLWVRGRMGLGFVDDESLVLSGLEHRLIINDRRTDMGHDSLVMKDSGC